MRDWMDDAPDVELYVTRRTKAARHDHRCCACPDPIRRGQPFARSVAKVDGKFTVSRFHAPMCPRDVREAEAQFAFDAELFGSSVAREPQANTGHTNGDSGKTS